MSNLKKFKVKFFGSKNRKEQIKQVKNLIVDAPKREAVEDVKCGSVDDGYGVHTSTKQCIERI